MDTEAKQEMRPELLETVMLFESCNLGEVKEILNHIKQNRLSETDHTECCDNALQLLRTSINKLDHLQAQYGEMNRAVVSN